MFRWLHDRRRRRLLSTTFPERWRRFLARNMWPYQYLTESQRSRIHDFVKVLIGEKYWEGCAGLAVSDEMRVTISGQAGLLVLGHQGFYYQRLQTILIFPDTIIHREMAQGDGTIKQDQPIAGAASRAGVVSFSWPDVLAGGRHAADGHNVVIHEFAHILDGTDGEMGGSPPFGKRDLERRWAEVSRRETNRLHTASLHGERTFLDHYGGTNEAEFFAVATESFFERPRGLDENHPEVFELLLELYQIDPRNWC